MDNHTIASEDSIKTFLAEHTNWRHENDALVTLYSLEDFATVMKVVNDVARAAEELHHHPNWGNEFNKLSFSLTTHEAENKVTERDLDLARAIDGIVASHTQ